MSSLASPGIMALLTFLAFLFLFLGFRKKSMDKAGKSAFETRLRDFQRQSSLSDDMSMETINLPNDESPGFLRSVGIIIHDMFLTGPAGKNVLDALDDWLDRAGHPHGWRSVDFIAFTVVLMGTIIIGGGLLVRAGAFPPILYVAAVAIFALMPYNMVNPHIAKRKEQAFAELPYFLDQIILNLSSGASTLNAALKNVVLDEAHDHLGNRRRVLIQEFRRAFLENQNQVYPFEVAFKNAAKRIQVQEVDDLVEVFINAETSGAPILGILQDMSVHVYMVFEQNMATLIKKKDTIFTVSTVMIMVSTAILIATPIVITLLDALSGGFV